MLMPDALFALVRTFAARYPVPTGVAGEAQEEACRQWTLHLAQQAAYAFPTMGYGTKRAGEGRPLSKDTIALQTITGLIGWDVLIGAGTGVPAVIGAPTESLDLTGQVFESVPAINWLGVTTPEPPPADDGRVCEECHLVLERLDVLVDSTLKSTAAVQDLRTLVAQLVALVTSLTRVQADGTKRLASQVENRVKVGW